MGILWFYLIDVEKDRWGHTHTLTEGQLSYPQLPWNHHHSPKIQPLCKNQLQLSQGSFVSYPFLVFPFNILYTTAKECLK